MTQSGRGEWRSLGLIEHHPAQPDKAHKWTLHTDTSRYEPMELSKVCAGAVDVLLTTSTGDDVAGHR